MKRTVAAFLALVLTLAVAAPAHAGQEILPNGTLIIPMDNALQGGGGFNLRAYGLAVHLLHSGVPLKWIINPTKGKDGIDFTASAFRVRPTAGAVASFSFRAGPLAIHPGFEAEALVVINTYNAAGNPNVNVYQLNAAATVNVDSTLLHKPKAAVFNQGENAAVHTAILAESGLISGTHYQVVTNANSITADSCFTVALEPHASPLQVSDAAVTGLFNFLQSGGNFLGQCQAVEAYTTRNLLSGFDSKDVLGGSMSYDNHSDPMAQFNGALNDEGGSVTSFKLTSNPGKRIAFSSADGSRYKAYVGRVTGVTTTNGGWVHYLAGHNYNKIGGIGGINGKRIVLNAVLRASDRPGDCGLSIGAEYRVTKVVNNSTPEVGQNVTFTITAINDGPLNAANVVVNDLLPTGLVYVSHSTTGGTYVPATGVWTIGALNNGASRTLTLTATATAAAIPSRTNTAVISASTPDINPNNNTASATVTPRYADLRAVKTVDNSTPTVGQNVTFGITITNLGPNNATGVTATDLLPAGLTYVSHSASIGLYNPASGIWNIGALNVGVSRTLTITATTTLAALPSVINSVSVTGNQFDPVPSNNFSSVTVNPIVTDLAINKTVDNGNQSVGGNVTFTLVASNFGPAVDSNVTVNDLLPAGLTYVSHDASHGTYSPGSGVWTIGELGVGATPARTLTITATVTEGAMPFVVNTATITGNVFDINLANNTSSATVSPGLVADLEVIKAVNNPTPLLGGQSIFTVTARNIGPFPATAVVVQDLLPAGLAYFSHTVSTGSYNPGTGQWLIGNLAVSTIENPNIETLTITVTIGAEAIPTATNVATITGAEFDPDTSNNISSVTVIPDVATDLKVLKTVNQSPVLVGDEVVFTILATNDGPSDATFVIVNDPLPLGFEYLSHTVTVGTYNPGSGIWTIGDLAVGPLAAQTMTITAKTNLLGGPLVINTAIISGRETDPTPLNNTSQAEVSILSGADLSIVKTVSEEFPLIGETVIFTLTISNAGPQNATGVVVTDILPDGLINPTNISSGGVIDGDTITWPPIDIDVGETVVFTLEATVAAPNP